MTTQRTLDRLDVLVWSAIYGGLFALVIGFVVRGLAPYTSWTLIVLGAVAVVSGVVLLLVRARLTASRG